MSEKTTTVDLATVIANGNYVFGMCGGLEEAAYLIRQRAGMFFQNKRDKEAHLYRNLAEEFDEIAKTKEGKYRSEHEAACDRAFDVLEERFGDIDLSEKTEKEN